MARAIRWVGWGLISLVGILILATGVGLWVLTQTAPGHDLALRMALDQTRDHIRGEVRVGGLRSGGLLRGAVLDGVEIRDEDGRHFATADSIRVRYSLRDLLRGRVILNPVDVWSPRVILEQLPGHDELNVIRIFVPPPSEEPPEEVPDDEEEPEEAPAEVRVELRGLAIHDGRLEIRLPVEGDPPGPRFLVEPFPGFEDALMQRFSFEAIDARLAGADLRDPELEGERFQVESLSLIGHVLDEPFHLREFRGEVDRQGDRIRLDAERFHLPETEATGTVAVRWGAEGSPEVSGRLDVPSLRLADLHWLEPGLPPLEGSLELEGSGWVDAGEWTVRSADLGMDGSRVRGTAGIRLGPELSFHGVDLELAPLALESLHPWLDGPLPVGGALRGTLQAEGTPAELQTRMALSLEDWDGDRPPLGVDLDGLLHLQEPFGATDLHATLDPLDYAFLGRIDERLAPLRGEGRLDVDGSGRWEGESRFRVELVHRGEDLPRSFISLTGTTRGAGAALEMDLEAGFAPLSLTSVATLFPEVPLSGETSGTVRARGRLDDLDLSSVLVTPGGPVQAAARLDATNPADGYDLTVQVRAFEVASVLTNAPDPTTVTGRLSVAGRGLDRETLAATGSVHVEDARVGGLDVTLMSAALEAREGRLQIDDFDLLTSLGSVQAAGDLALLDDLPSGEVRIEWETESLAGLRPLVMGDTVIAADTLSPLDRDILIMDGLDPDELPAEAEVAVDGRARGWATLSGWIERFDAEGRIQVDEGIFGPHSLARVRADFAGRGLPGEGWTGEVTAETDSLVLREREFRSARVEASYQGGEGEVRLEVDKDEAEEYRVAGRYRLEEEGGSAEVREFSARFAEPDPWRLERPTTIRWTAADVTMDTLRIARASPTPMSIEVWGVLPRRGGADFHVEVEGVELLEIARLAQWEGDVAGIMDLSLEIHGTADDPEIEGDVEIEGFRFQGAELSRVAGSMYYRDRRVAGDLEAHREGRRLFRLAGDLAADLSFREVANRFPDESMGLRLAADSVPAATALAFIDVLEDVEGVLDGEVRLTGTPSDPRPQGTLRLRGGSVHLPEIGLRPTGIALDLELQPDQVVRVSGDARARGTARVDGTLLLESLTDPGFDLRLTAANFQAVERRDLAARIGGELTLTGRYTQPRVEGDLRVEQGTIFLEEFQRTAEVVDLTHPSFFDVVDTTLVSVRPVIAAAQNPFLQRLVVQVDMTVERDFWLRSRDMNVEMAGELIVTYARPPEGEILLVGTLEAVRGAYSAFGRQFQVQEGTVDFVGTPGINPNLDIQAVNRLRREGGEPLEITAGVEGTLMNPRVQLSSDAQPPIAESDLISYLIFGRPSYALGSGEASILEGAAGAGVSLGLGTVATQLGTALAREIGIDYIAITQQEGVGLLADRAGVAGSFAETQIEIGQYVGQNLFLAVLLRPLTGLGAQAQSQFPGARLEWRFADLWTAEAFVEDRFAREGISGFGELGIRLDRTLGVSLFREWSY